MSRLPICNFSAGELSPKMMGRIDFDKYSAGCSVLRNYVILPHGGVTRRPGTYYAAETKDSSRASRLIPFVFSNVQAYMLEFGEEYIRFYKDKGQIVSGSSAYEISTPYQETDLPDLHYTQSADTMYITHPDYPPMKLTRTGHTSWTLTEVEFQKGPFESDEQNTLITPSATSGDITLSSTASIFSSTDEGRLIAINQVGTFSASASATITISGTTGTVTVTSTSDIFEIAHVGCVLALDISGTWYYLYVEQYNTAREIIATVKGSNLGGTSATHWKIGAQYTNTWKYLVIKTYNSATSVVINVQGSDNLISTNPAISCKLGTWCSALGYPKTVTFFEQRLVMGGSASYPQTVWGSQSADYENFLSGVNDSDAITFTIADDEVNAIVWMIPRDVLLIGTTGGEARMGASTTAEPITPTNVSVRIPTNRGSSNAKPLRVGASTLFVQRGGRTVREIFYDLDTDSHKADSVSILSEHITKGGIVDAAYQQEPYSIAWFVRGDGAILGLTFLREHNVIGWHRHDTDGVIESVACIEGSGSEDELWMIVKRTINGVDKRYVEYMMPFEYEDQEDGFFVDCGLTYDSATPTSTLTGLDHLEGETVQVMVDGATHPDCTVASGAITLTRSGYVVHAGLAYESHLKTVNLEIQTPSGTSQGRPRKIIECVIKFLDTLGAKAGRDEDHLEVIPFRSPADPMDSPPPLFTGDKKQKVFRGDWSNDAYVYIVQDLPQPMTILSILPVFDIKEG